MQTKSFLCAQDLRKMLRGYLNEFYFAHQFHVDPQKRERVTDCLQVVFYSRTDNSPNELQTALEEMLNNIPKGNKPKIYKIMLNFVT